MKHLSRVIMTIALSIPFLFINHNAYAAKPINVQINGQTLYFDQATVVEKSRVLVPMRTIFEAVGAKVEWSQKTKTVKATKGNTIISLTIGSKQATINGDKKSLDVPAKSLNGRTLVPLRFVSEALDCEVKWDSAQSLVTITFDGEIKEPTGKVYPDGWVAPVLESSWNPDIMANYQTLQNELGFKNDGRTYGVTGRSKAIVVADESPSSPYEVAITFYMWEDSYIPESYRIPIVTKELFKLYFGNDATKVWSYFPNNVPDNFTANGRNVVVFEDANSGSLMLRVGRE